VAVAVEPDLVAGGDDARRDVAEALHLLADEEERRRRACRGEQFEDGGGARGVRPVVERQRDAPRVRQDSRNAGQTRHPGHDGCGCRPAPGGRRSQHTGHGDAAAVGTRAHDTEP